jgi:hypothetical protein
MNGEVVSVDQTSVTIRDAGTGSLRTLSVSDANSLSNIKKGDRVRASLSSADSTSASSIMKE